MILTFGYHWCIREVLGLLLIVFPKLETKKDPPPKIWAS